MSANPFHTPLVSVVVAAYGRPAILPYALRSAVAQTHANIEIIVVGDAAGAETARAVEDVGDYRMSFIDLPFNYGEQSGPNNVGVARARGHFIAFLNQDDIWFPDHLEVNLAWLEATGSDLVLSHGAIVHPSTPAELTAGTWRCSLTSIGRRGHYDPVTTTAPASTWLLRRELHERLRGWRPALECRTESSRDVLVRAWRARARLRIVPHLSLVIVQSGARPASYLGADHHEHAHFAAAMARDAPALRACLLDRMTVHKPPGSVRRLTDPVRRLAVRWGAPLHLSSLWRPHRRRGSMIKRLRARRGLPPMLPLGADVEDLRLACAMRSRVPVEPRAEIGFGAGGEGYRLRAGGWSMPTAEGCEMGDAQARLLLCPPPSRKGAVELAALSAFTGPANAIDLYIGEARIASWGGTPGAPPCVRRAIIPVTPGIGEVIVTLRARSSSLHGVMRMWPRTKRPGFNVLSLGVTPMEEVGQEPPADGEGLARSEPAGAPALTLRRAGR